MSLTVIVLPSVEPPPTFTTHSTRSPTVPERVRRFGDRHHPPLRASAVAAEAGARAATRTIEISKSGVDGEGSHADIVPVLPAHLFALGAYCLLARICSCSCFFVSFLTFSCAETGVLPALCVGLPARHRSRIAQATERRTGGRPSSEGTLGGP